MTLTPTDRIPDELMHADRAADVVRYLIATPLPGTLKVRILKGFYIHFGLPADPQAIREVEASGT
jgi:hypothetical protein